MATEKLLAGVHTAALTTLTRDLELDTAAYLTHCRWLLDNGSDGVGVLGTTGEANSLSMDQRQQLIEASTTSLPPQRLLVGTGSCSVIDATKLTKISLSGGANNVLLLPPFYYKPVTDAGVHRFIATLVDKVADDRLRLYLYNFPQMTTYGFSVEFIGRLRDEFGPVIAGMKDSSGDWQHMHDSITNLPGFDVFAGTEQYLLDTLQAGGSGCISATANITGAACQAVYQAWKAGNRDAASLQDQLTAVRLTLQANPAVPALKALMQRHTGDGIWSTVLPPFTPFADAERLAGEIAALGLSAPGGRLSEAA